MESVSASSNLSLESTKKIKNVFLKLYYGNIDDGSIHVRADIYQADFNCGDSRIQSILTCSKSTIEALEQDVKYVHS